MSMKDMKEMEHYKKQSKAVEAMVMKPMLCLSASDLPDIDEWEIGKEYKMEVTARLKSKNEQEDEGGESMDARFEIKKVRSLE